LEDLFRGFLLYDRGIDDLGLLHATASRFAFRQGGEYLAGIWHPSLGGAHFHPELLALGHHRADHRRAAGAGPYPLCSFGRG
jgi:hypothetical protein